MFERTLGHHIKTALSDTPVVLINGARQTGKSTLAKEILNPQQYITFDDLETLTTAQLNLQSFIENLSTPIVLDEIQRIPELFVALKARIDKARKAGQFLLTGSANVLLLPKLSDSLAGRIEIATLWPLSQGEILGHEESFLKNIVNNKLPQQFISKINIQQLVHLLTTGGYPEVVQRQQTERKTAWFRSYLTTIVQRDIRDLASISGISELPNLLRILATRAGCLLNFAELSRTASIPVTTLKRYFTLLETTFQIYQLLPWTKNLTKRFVKTPKLFFTDTGVLCHLLNATTEKLITTPNLMGHVIENFVINELHKQASFMINPPIFSHFRSQSGVEVDLIIEIDNDHLIGIEIKSAASVSKKDFSGLSYFAEKMGKKLQLGMVLYGGKQIIHYQDNFYAIPLDTVWLS